MFILKRKASRTLIFLILFMVSSTFVFQPVNAQETEGTIGDQAFIINGDWLAVSVSEFNGQPLDYTGKLDRLNIDVGGYGMKDFINHGEIAVDKVTDTHVYMAEMNFPVSVVLYTDCMIDDVYPDHYTGTSHEEWLELTTMQHWSGGVRLLWGSVHHQTYDVAYRKIHTGAIDTQEYDGNLRLNAVISPDLPIEEGDLITINGVEFKVPDMRIFIKNAEILERTYGVCDPGTQNYYTDNEGVDAYRKEDLEDLDYSHDKSDARDECGDGKNSNSGDPAKVPYRGITTAADQIRWAGVHDRERYYGVTYTSGEVGQAFASAPTVGTVWSRTDDLNDYDEEFDFDSHIRIKPNVFYDMERFDVRHTYLYVDRYYAWNSLDYGLCDIKDEYVDTMTRVIGLGVQNLFIKMKYNFKVTMLLSIQALSDEGEKILEDPEVYQGDIVWDNTIGGTTDAKATVASPRTPFDDLGDIGSLEDIGEWFDEQLDWWKDQIEDAAENWYDWWDNLPGAFTNFFDKYLWIILLGIAIVVIIVVVIYFSPRILRGVTQARGERQRQKIETERYHQNQHR